MVRIEDLKIFVDVVQNHSMNLAAEKNFTSPQNLSKIIKRMEDELGVVLFKRSKKGSDLTTFGERFYLHIIEVLQHYNDAMLAIGAETDNGSKHLDNEQKEIMKVLCTSGVMSYAVMDSYNKVQHEDFGLILEEDEINFSETKKIINYIQERDFDVIACLILQEGIDDIVSALADYLLVHVLFDELVLVVSSKNPLARRSMIPAEEVKRLNMVSFKGFSLANELIDFNAQCQIMTNSHAKALEQVRHSDSCCTLLFKSFCEINTIEFGKNGDFKMIRLDKKIYGTNLILVRKNCLENKKIMHFIKELEEDFFGSNANMK